MIKTVVYKNCSEIPLGVFLSIMYENDYSLMVVKKGLTKPNLKDCWNVIYEEYNELSDDGGNQVFFQMIKQKTILQNKIFITQTCIDGLKNYYNLELVNVLKKMGFNFKFSKESLIRDLQKVVAKSKPFLLQLTKLNKEIQPFLSGDQLKISDFDDILVSLSKFQGYRINKNEVSVSEFVKILNNYKKWQTLKK